MMKHILSLSFLLLVLVACKKPSGTVTQSNAIKLQQAHGSYQGQGINTHDRYANYDSPKYVHTVTTSLDTLVFNKTSDNSVTVTTKFNTYTFTGTLSDTNSFQSAWYHDRYSVRIYPETDSIVFRWFSGSYSSSGQSTYDYEFSGRKIR
jgi:hypothetical protein